MALNITLTANVSQSLCDTGGVPGQWHATGAHHFTSLNDPTSHSTPGNVRWRRCFHLNGVAVDACYTCFIRCLLFISFLHFFLFLVGGACFAMWCVTLLQMFLTHLLLPFTSTSCWAQPPNHSYLSLLLPSPSPPYTFLGHKLKKPPPLVGREVWEGVACSEEPPPNIFHPRALATQQFFFKALYKWMQPPGRTGL